MDKIANLINGIKNASLAGKKTVDFPYSNFLAEIAKTLLKHEFIAGYEKKLKDNKPFLIIELRYQKTGQPKIAGVKRISKSSRRVYFGNRDIKDVKFGHGMVILTTPKGVLSGVDAKKEMVGGEALFEIW